jgi:MobA/VirD2-like, nuclease domain/TraI-like middle domain
MIASAGTGKGFGGLTRYLLHGRDGEDSERVAWVSLRNLRTHDPGKVAEEMRAIAEQAPRVEKPVYHVSLSLAPGESLSREQWEAVADRLLRDLGLEQHQAMIVAHRDHDYEHVHLVVNRVHIERLRAWDKSFDYQRIEKSLRHIERELGLREVPGRHYQLGEQERPERAEGRSRAERHQAERTGQEPWVEQLRREVAGELREAKSWAELEHRLEQHGLRVEARGRGMVVTDGEREVKASRILRTASRGRLEERFGQRLEDWRLQRRELVDAVEALATHDDKRQALFDREVDAHQQMQRVKEAEVRLREAQREYDRWTNSLDRWMEKVYRRREIEGVRAQIGRGVERDGWERTAQRLGREPEAFGSLRGRAVGGLETPERRTARDAARQVGLNFARIGELRAGMERDWRFIEKERPHVPEARRRAQEAVLAMRELPSTQFLERQLARMVARVGIETARLVLNPTALQIARAAVRAVRLAREMGSEMERGR